MNKNPRSSQFLFILSVFMAMLLSGCGGGGQSEQTAGSGNPSVRSFAADPAPQITLTSSSISKTTVAAGETQTVQATIKSNIAAQNLYASLRIVNSQLTGIETIRMSGGGNQTLTLNSPDVVDLGTGVFNPSGAGFLEEDAVRVDGDAGDVLNLSNGSGQWVDITASIVNEPSGYKVFAFDSVPGGAINAQSYVIVDEDVTVNTVT